MTSTAVAADWYSAPSLGDIGSLVQAFAGCAGVMVGVVTLLLAGWAAIEAKRLYGIESERDRQAALAGRQRQAELMSAWELESEVVFCNASNAPIYRAIASRAKIGRRVQLIPTQGSTDYRALCDRVLPNMSLIVSYTKWGGGAAGMRTDVELAFTDNAGRHWLKPSRGALREIDLEPTEYYGLPDPLGWSNGRPWR